MSIMTPGVHFSLHCGAPGLSRHFLDRKRVHVGSQGDCRPFAAASLNDSYNVRACNARLNPVAPNEASFSVRTSRSREHRSRVQGFNGGAFANQLLHREGPENLQQ